ncbi:hypothetical protein ACFQ0K_07430 [Nocardioides caeni]|uniref:Uncharacterized protein n=1 Tax=Nocardioides caeni TaxID=574700 RepID=A0A4S8N2X5_9ACTN|nr:hypothetical protein [Nocardioides caeni]THV09094.1 hypothetical protein E9934_17460 [Nocardioides caeni]
MKKTALGLGSMLLVASFSLSACGTDEGELAKEYCDLAQDAQDAAESGDAGKIEDATKALTDWLEDNKDVEGDEKEFTDAVEDECGDLSTVP